MQPTGTYKVSHQLQKAVFECLPSIFDRFQKRHGRLQNCVLKAAENRTADREQAARL